jgi:pimeloyl-ACP methyl ester carboxylesterase
MTDVTKRTHYLAPFAAAAALFLVLAPTAGSTAQEASAEARKPCPRGSVAAVIGGQRTCLRAGQRCRHGLDRQYHRNRFHCHSGRLSKMAKSKPADFFYREIDVGGHRLAIRCRGTGRPTIVLESGGGMSARESWFVTVYHLVKTTRVCWYDRAGLGLSEARRPPDPVPAAQAVVELHSLLAGAGIAPPYVLGGWSFGSFFNRLYTKRYPAEVSGLVLVDGTPIGLPGGGSWESEYPPPPRPGIPDWYYLADAVAELAATPGLGARPLVVLTHGLTDGWPEFEAQWVQWQKQVALLSSSSILVRADTAGHAIQIEDPDLTAEAFRLVIQAVRRSAPLPACGATRLPDIWGTCLDPASP